MRKFITLKRKSRNNTKQHTIPKWYLKQFTYDFKRNGKPVYFYDIEKHRKEIDNVDNWEKRNPKTISVKKYFYDIEYSINGEKYIDDRLDKMLQTIEDLSGKVFHNTITKKSTLSNQDREIFTRFVASMFVRTKHAFSEIQNMGPQLLDICLQMESNKIKKYCKDMNWGYIPNNKIEFLRLQYERQTGITLPEDIDERYFRDLIKQGYEMSRNGVRNHPKEAIQHYLSLIIDTSWKIFFIEENHNNFFITSDRPAFLNTKEKINSAKQLKQYIKEGLVGICLPLSQNIMMVASKTGQETKYIEIKKDKIKEVNREIAYQSNEFIISPKKGYPGQEYFSSDFLVRTS